MDSQSLRAPYAAGQRHMLQRLEHASASNDRTLDDLPEDLDLAASGECTFEIYREGEDRVSSTQFCGGDWRWRLVTTDGLVLAEAAGYPNQGTCEAAVQVLRKRAATAPVITLGMGDSR